MLRQALLNLTLNSAQPIGGGAGEIRFESIVHDNRLLLRDGGTGMGLSMTANKMYCYIIKTALARNGHNVSATLRERWDRHAKRFAIEYKNMACKPISNCLADIADTSHLSLLCLAS